MVQFDEFRGMSYEQASREATRLIEHRGWFQSFERLAVLREIMLRGTRFEHVAEAAAVADALNKAA